jgi:hypothetical protein
MAAIKRWPRRSKGWFVAALVTGVAAAAGATVAVVLTTGDDDTSRSSDPGVSHVHGLGINPADRSLIVATHYGSFRLPAGDGDAERIGDSYHDTMGFTVAGPDHFLGSGHPDLAGARAGQPTQLGLIESTDGGASWDALSLSGQADFHALAYTDNQVYGWDAGTGRFMVSADRRTWDTRSTLDLYGFAADPANPDHLIAATPSGIADSADGGRTWTAVDGPQLVTIGWHPDSGLWGADPAGVVWHHDGDRWSEAGQLPGQPQAFLAADDGLYAAVFDDHDETGIYQSTDDGHTWTLRYQDDQP